MGNTISFFRQIKDSSSTAEHIEKSKSHWSERSGESGCSSAEEIEDNRKVFKDLLLHSTWGGFFTIFGKYLGPIAYRSAGLLSVGEKIAEGGQAEIYEAHIKWGNKVFRKRCEEEGAVFVLKVFESGVSLRHLQSKWPEGLLKYRAVIAEREKLHIPQPLQYGCDVQCATVLKDGRFAFVMRREDEDLRSLIDRKRRFQWRHGPFRDEIAKGMMYKIARGMDWLHGCNIVHRDFKASR